MLRITCLLVLGAIACHAAPVSDDEAVNQIYNSVIVGDYETALAETMNLEKEQRGPVVSKLVNKLIDENQPNSMMYAYQLWNNDGQDIVKSYFPIQFRLIFSQLTVKLVNKRDGMELKLGYRVDSDGDRTAYGDYHQVGERAGWKLIPVQDSDKRVYFNIYNAQYNQYLKLGTDTDSDGDHSVYGSPGSDTYRHQWYLKAVLFNKEILFLIYNREYNQALKLGRAVDSDGDRQAFSHNGNVAGSPDLFGWYIMPY